MKGLRCNRIVSKVSSLRTLEKWFTRKLWINTSAIAKLNLQEHNSREIRHKHKEETSNRQTVVKHEPGTDPGTPADRLLTTAAPAPREFRPSHLAAKGVGDREVRQFGAIHYVCGQTDGSASKLLLRWTDGRRG